MNINLQTNIVAAFPLSGKSWLADRHPDLFVDIDVSLYDKQVSDTGAAVGNREFPGNYVRAACKAAVENPGKTILVSASADVLKCFTTRAVYPLVICPEETHGALYEWKARHMARPGSPISKDELVSSFYKWVSDIKSVVVRNGLSMLMIRSDMYLSDIFTVSEPMPVLSEDTYMVLDLTHDEALHFHTMLEQYFYNLGDKLKDAAPRLHTPGARSFNRLYATCLELERKWSLGVKSATALRRMKSASEKM